MELLGIFSISLLSEIITSQKFFTTNTKEIEIKLIHLWKNIHIFLYFIYTYIYIYIYIYMSLVKRTKESQNVQHYIGVKKFFYK